MRCAYSVWTTGCRGQPLPPTAEVILIAFFDQIFGECHRLTNWGGSEILRKMHRGIATVAIALPAIFAARLVCATTNVELLVDDSGSMAQRVTGGRKIDVAKQVLPGLIQDMPADPQIAVRTYGRQHPSHERDCSDMELLTSFGANTPQRILPGVNALKPNGITPIAASLQAGAKDFAGKEGQNKTSSSYSPTARKIATAIRVPHRRRFSHWVRVIKIERGAKGWPDSVIYGDPWTGTQCQAASCVFRSSMIDATVAANKDNQFGIVFATC